MTPPRRPPRLAVGDTVAVVAPCGPLVPSRLEAGVGLLESWGLQVRVGDHALDSTGDGMLAGTDADRAGDLQRAWCDPEVRAVLVARGGYGAMRVLDRLDWAAMAQAGPRVLVGASDVTALHTAVRERLGLVTLHGPMPASELLTEPAPEPRSAEALRRALLEPQTVTAVAAEPADVIAPGRARGRLVGGNLALLAATLGAPEATPARGRVVLVEDVDEPPYRVDRMLTTLLRAGWLSGARAVVAGSFERCGDVRPVLVDRLAGLGVPVLAGLPVGHGPVQLTVPLGDEVTVDTDAGVVRLSRPPLAER